MGKCVCPPEKGSKKVKAPKGGKKPAPKKGGGGGGPKTKPLKPKPGKTTKGGTGGKGGGKKTIVAKKSGKSNRHANMFILYFLEMFRLHRGNMYCIAKECGRRWWTLPQSEKDRYKKMYCEKCKGCKSCNKPKKAAEE